MTAVKLIVNMLGSKNKSSAEVDLKELQEKHKDRKEKVSDFSPAMKKASIYLDSWVQRNFKSDGGNVGGWKPLSDVTLLLRKWEKQGVKIGGATVGQAAFLLNASSAIAATGLAGSDLVGNLPSARPLKKTGRLRVSFFPWATKKNAGIGSDLPYSEYHQKGTKGIPQRRMLPEADEVREDITKILEDHVSVSIDDKKGNKLS